MRKTNGQNGRGLRRALLAAALLLAGTLPAQAQDFYVITNGNNILAHPTATTIGNVTGNSFNINTCLWTIDGNKIATVTPEGTTGYQIYWTGDNQALTLRATGDDYNNVSDGQNPYNTYRGTNYYIVYNNNGWRISSTNSNNGTMHRVTVTTNTTAGSTPTSESYTATIDGNTAIYTTGAHNFSQTITHSATYTTTTTKTFSVSINGTPRSGNVSESSSTTTTETYTGALTNVAWSVSDDTYGDINASTGELTITSLPTSVDNITVTYTAQVAGQTVTATKQVTLMSAATYADAVDGGTTGVTATTVTLNDYEDHSWSYYNKADNSPIRSWNPANVKISYYGYGAKYTTQSDGNPTGSLTAITSSNALVRVGPLNGETQHTFVYYKTLERTDGTTAANPTGRCEYRTIPNPFSVRPRIIHNNSGGTGNSATNYTGFYMWRLKTLEGGAIYDDATGDNSIAVGSTVDAEQVLYFAPSGEYGMTVEFEAIWAPAYVTGSTHASTHNAYERNFYIGARTSALNYAATISAIYPDGTNGSNTNLLTAVPNTTQSSDYTCGADTKFEYIQFTAQTLNGNGHNLIVGRGVTGTGNQYVYGINSTGASLNFSMRIESGTFGSLSIAGNGGYTHSGVCSMRCTLGCDYDRAYSETASDNSKLHIATGDTYHDMYGSDYNNNNNSAVFSSAENKENLTFDWLIKSGTFNRNDPGDAAAERSIYIGSVGSPRYVGKRRITLEGGTVANIAGSLNHSDQRYDRSGYNYNSTYTDSSVNDMVQIRVRGVAVVRGSIYGAAAFAGAAGGRRYVITGGKIGGWIAGGCNGTQTTGGEMYGNSFIYFGGKARCDSEGNTTAINSSIGGNIFGAGSGINGGTTVGQVSHSTIVIADDGFVERDVYGGGNYGYVNTGTGHGSDIYIMGGTVNGKVFGGSNQQQGQIVNINMTGGQVIGGVYGGSNSSGTVAGPVNVTVSGGTVGTAGINPATSETGHVFGSGYGAGTSVSGNVQVTIGDATGSHKDSPLIYGNVYGGGFAAPYTSNGKTFQVTGQNGLVKGSIFGGGKGNTAVVTGPTDVLIKGNIEVEGNVFGGGDAAAVTGNTSVKLQD